MRRTWARSMAAVVGALAVACGSGGDSTPEPAPPSPGTPTVEGTPSAGGTTAAPDDGAAPAGGFAAEIDGSGPWDWTVTSIGKGTKPGIALAEDGTPLIAYILERLGDAGFVNVSSGTPGAFSIETLQTGYLYGPLDITAGPQGAVVAYHNHDWEDAAVAIQGESGWDVSRISDGGHDGWDGSLAIGADGSLHVLGVDPSQFGATEGVEYAVQGGDGWLVEPIGSGPQPYEWGTDIAIDANGVLHAVYFDAAASDLVYARREAGAWELTAIYEDGDAGRFPAIVLDADGLPHVAFIQSDSPIADDGRHSVTVLYGSPAGGEWAFEAVTVLDSVLTGFDGARRTVAIDVGPDGPVVAAIDEAQLVLARLVDGAWVPETLLEAGADPLQVVGLALDAGGAPHLTFATTTGNGPLDGEVWYLEPSAG